MLHVTDMYATLLRSSLGAALEAAEEARWDGSLGDASGGEGPAPHKEI